MKVIPEPAEGTRSVLVPEKGIRGQGTKSYTCGNCGKTLVRNINAMQVRGVVIKCVKCDAFNEIPAAHQGH